ncbi:hypothetical protein NKJ70_22765 [Mesorhizobium sp. M0092]
MDDTAIDGTKKEKQNVKSASNSILWEGGLGETAPTKKGSPPWSNPCPGNLDGRLLLKGLPHSLYPELEGAG